MYQPKHFQISEQAQMLSIIESHPLATLIAGQGDQMQINHVPMLFAAGRSDALHCHVARANPVWQLLAEQPEVVAVFTGTERYISPNWYASKAADGKVVPTWNYEAVHVYGKAIVRDDPQWLAELLERLTNTHEAGQARPWKVSDAPDDYIAARMGGIVGIEVPIRRWQGKAKLSQNQPANNRNSVAAGLRGQASADASASLDMAEKMGHIRT